jgi:ureidoglycolate lyase
MTGGSRRIPAEPLAAAAFAPFGQVLEAPGGPGRVVNLGTARRHDRAAALENTRSAAEPNVAVFRCRPQALPFRITLLERHAHSSQLFAALRAHRWLVVVAPALPDGGPDTGGLRAFLCGPGQGVNLARGVWHHPVVALDEPAELLMLAWEDGGPGDCEEHPLAAGPEVVAPPE